MEKVKEFGIPLLCHLNVYQTDKGHLLGLTILWKFTVDFLIEREHLDFTVGIHKVYASMGFGYN
jgi:hypothetical protein